MESTHARDKEQSVRAGWVTGVASLIPEIVSVIIGNSTTLLADALRTASETLASFLAWLSLRKIAAGKTARFNYGYGKLEDLSSLAVALAMGLSFIIVLFTAIERLRHPEPVGQVGLGAAIVSLALVINITLWRRNLRLARKEPSPIMEAQWRLFRTKTAANIAVLAALGVSVFFRDSWWSVYADPIGSLILSGFLLVSAYRVAFESVHGLLDRTVEEVVQMIIVRELVVHFDEYLRFHGARSRQSGGNVYIELFLEFDPNRPMGDVQAAIDRMRAGLEARIQNSHVSVVPTTEPVTL